MKIININSKFDITKAQQSFAEEIISFGFDERIKHADSISWLMEKIPVFLLSPESMPNEVEGEGEGEGEGRRNPPTEYLGYYEHSHPILGANIPVICLCPERILSQVNSDEELTFLVAKVIIHEFAHAKMRTHCRSDYGPIDEFYKWMEESMANLITLKYFEAAQSLYLHPSRRPQQLLKSAIKPIDYVIDFISKQPPNYQLGLDLFRHDIIYWWEWSNYKNDIKNKGNEKQQWLQYVKSEVGKTEKVELKSLFKALHK